MGDTRDKPPHQSLSDDSTVVDGRMPGAASLPSVIGPYQVKGIIGSGGMGTVVLAQQDNPRRDVAIKIMNSGVVSRKALRRFEFEAQTLGRLQHPAIAQVYEAGTFDDGDGARPFFAMEYVADARELDDYVASQSLDTAARLTLFRAICAGVEYGHQRGVIHRDLKPGNILVDAEGHPKIIDFGVARSTESDSVSATLATEAGQIIGTLQYMSPEQVDLEPSGLDTRSDIYALGVILYQLMVGRLPYDLVDVSLAKAAEFIRTVQPARPSEINPTFKGDLETICLKALEKDRERRYQSVGDLSEDLRRFLADESIMARPPTRGEQLGRLIRKNKAASIATVVVALSLVAATIISIVFATDAMRQRDAAEIARANAEELAKVQLTQLASFDLAAMGASLGATMQDELQLDAASLADVDFTGAAMELMQEHFYGPTLDQIKESFAGQPLVQARMLQTLADVMRNAGVYRDAVDAQVIALEIYTDELGRAHRSSVFSLVKTGNLLGSLGELEDAWIYLEEAHDLTQRYHGEDKPLCITTKTAIGFHLHNYDIDFEAAKLYWEDALRLSRDAFGDEHPMTMSVIGNMALNYENRNMPEEALSLYLKAYEYQVREYGKDDTNALAVQDVLGPLMIRLGRYEEGEAMLLDCLERNRRVRGAKHNRTLISLTRLASLRLQERRYAEASTYLEEALAGSAETLGDSHPRTIQRFNLIIDLHEQWHEAEPGMGHDATAADYQSRLDVITAERELGERSATP
ncbi:MAG: serine/threonine-protein kinase [Phycisphaerales bacterium]|nr:serine/threonine-protein kinase [Phycisphaerales bacterium]